MHTVEVDDIRAARDVSQLLSTLRLLMDRTQVAFFCGSGISITPPACIPTVALVYADLELYLKTRFQAEPYQYLRSSEFSALTAEAIRRVPFELLVECLLESYEPERNVTSFFGAFLEREPNSFHTSIARMALQARKMDIITTNFDSLLEKALENVGAKYTVRFQRREPMWKLWEHRIQLSKIHGSLESVGERLKTDSMMFLLRDLEPLRGWKERTVTRVFTNKCVVFLGYSFSDFADIAPLLCSLSPRGCVYTIYNPSTTLTLRSPQEVNTENDYLRAFLRKGKTVVVEGDTRHFFKLLCGESSHDDPSGSARILKISDFLSPSLHDFILLARLFQIPSLMPGSQRFFETFVQKCEEVQSNVSLAYHDLAAVHESEGRREEAITAALAAYVSACKGSSTTWLDLYMQSAATPSSFRDLRRSVAEYWRGRGWAFLDVYSGLSLNPGFRFQVTKSANRPNDDIDFFLKTKHEIGLTYDLYMDVRNPEMAGLNEHQIRNQFHRLMDLHLLEDQAYILQCAIHLSALLLRNGELPMHFHFAHTLDSIVMGYFRDLKKYRRDLSETVLGKKRAMEIIRIHNDCYIVAMFLRAADEILAGGGDVPFRYEPQIQRRLRRMMSDGSRTGDWETGLFVWCLSYISARLLKTKHGDSFRKLVEAKAENLAKAAPEAFFNQTGYRLRML